MYNVLTLNNISTKGLDQLPRDRFEVSSDTQSPDAVLLRSAKLHDWDIPPTLKAVGRAETRLNVRGVLTALDRGMVDIDG